MFRKKKVKYRTEDDVKKALGIETFRNLSKDKVIDFMAIAPQMDKDVLISSINQFPQYTNLAGDIVKQIKGLSETALKENTKSQEMVIKAYSKIIDTYAEEIKSNKISRRRKRELRFRMEEIADKAAVKDSENKTLIKSIFKTTATVGSIIFILTASLIGINIKS